MSRLFAGSMFSPFGDCVSSPVVASHSPYEHTTVHLMVHWQNYTSLVGLVGLSVQSLTNEQT